MNSTRELKSFYRLIATGLVLTAATAQGWAGDDNARAAVAADKPIRILLIGNSYVGGVRSAIQQTLAASPAYRGVYTEFVTPGGRRLEQHTANDKLLQRIAEGKWDYVVLQEQSQVPSFPSPYSDGFFKASKALCERIRAAGASPVFFMTWGRRDGDKQNLAVNPDFATMQRNLSKSYRRAAEENKAILLPVGDVFAELQKRDKDLWKDLYRGDGSHPSGKGAAVFVCVLLHELFEAELDAVRIPGIRAGERSRIKAAVESVDESTH